MPPSCWTRISPDGSAVTRYFLAGRSIRPGQNFRKALSGASAAAGVLLVVIGPRWLDHEPDGNPLENKENWTRKEIINAIKHDARIVPILCGRAVPRLSRASLPRELARLADYQSMTLDNAEEDLPKIARHLVETVPGLTDRTTAQASSDEPGSTRNSVDGGSGAVIQARDVQLSGGSVGRTVVNGPKGPVHTGDGPMYTDPIFHGDGNNYVAGTNRGGIHQNSGIRKNPEDDR